MNDLQPNYNSNMPMFSLVTAVETDGGQTFIVNQNHITKDIPGGGYIKDFVIEYIKSKNCDTQIGQGNFKKDDFIIYYIRIGEPPITLFAFTNKRYSNSLAYDCLEEYREIALSNCDKLNVEGATRDMNKTFKAAGELLKRYNTGLNVIKAQDYKNQVSQLTAQARVNLEKTQHLQDQSNDVNLMTKQMQRDAQSFNTDMDKRNKIKCSIM